MNPCHYCGGLIKTVAKPGRMFLFESQYWEIPAEMKLPTCLDCGLFSDEIYYNSKLKKICSAQLQIPPSPKLKFLRHIDSQIRDVLENPLMFGDSCCVELAVLVLINMRYFVSHKSSQSNVTETYRKFITKRFPTDDPVNDFLDLDVVSEVATTLSEFSNVWINVI